MDPSRYILDPLYGRVDLPSYVWITSTVPELQRLREVRMCNINSLSLTGAASVNRFEHAIGTAHLARVWAQAWPLGLDPASTKVFILAALLHDIGSAAFGHSVEYQLSRHGFEHESLFDLLRAQPVSDAHSGFPYRHTTYDPVYFGLRRELPNVLSDEELKSIASLVRGEGTLGPLISGSIDLDNIDNVYRLAYHMGIKRSPRPAMTLTRGLFMREGRLTILDQAVPALTDWIATRERLYDYLLLNPDEFSAKCMLERALHLTRSNREIWENWTHVDNSLIDTLFRIGGEAKTIVQRLMTGRLYGCGGIFECQDLNTWDTLSDWPSRLSLEQMLSRHVRACGSRYKSANVVLHAIRDVNKTRRRISLDSETGDTIAHANAGRDRILLGIFFSNATLDCHEIDSDKLVADGVRDRLLRLARQRLDSSTRFIRPYSEGYGAQDREVHRDGG